VAESGERVVIERERRILPEHAPAPSWPFRREQDERDGLAERNVIELDTVSVAALLREGAEAGLQPQPTRELPPTDEHVGSNVVMLRA
jgi:hypothetical protein